MFPLGGKASSESLVFVCFRGTVSTDFTAACQFLSDHMDNMENPNEEMVCNFPALYYIVSVPVNVSFHSPEESPGRVVSALVQCSSRGDFRGQQGGRVPEGGEENHTFAARLPHQPGGRQQQHGSALQHFPLQLQHRQPAARHGSDECAARDVVHGPSWLEILKMFLCATGVSDVNLQNNAGYTAVMLASLTAPDGPGGMEVIRKLMELGNINVRSSQVTPPSKILN